MCENIIYLENIQLKDDKFPGECSVQWNDYSDDAVTRVKE